MLIVKGYRVSYPCPTLDRCLLLRTVASNEDGIQSYSQPRGYGPLPWAIVSPDANVCIRNVLFSRPDLLGTIDGDRLLEVPTVEMIETGHTDGPSVR